MQNEPIRTLVLAALVTASFAQKPIPRFEIASIKSPGPKDPFIALFNYPGGRIRITNYTFAQLLEEACRVQRFQISGGPRMDRFRAVRDRCEAAGLTQAKCLHALQSRGAAGCGAAPDAARSADRPFSAEVSLVKGREAPRLEPAKHPGQRMFLAGLLGGGDGTVRGGNATLDFVARQLSRSPGHSVLDRTGLIGAFDFTLANIYDPEERDPVTIAQRAVRGIGLKLKSSRALIETIFIDHVEKPSAN